MRTLVSVAMVVAGVVGCGGGGGGGGGDAPVTADEAADLCRAACERDEACNPTEPADACTAECAAEYAGWADPDQLERFADCYAALACDVEGGEGTCYGQVEPQAVHEEYEARCRAYLAACPDALLPVESCEVSHDPARDGNLVRFIADEIVDEMIACFDVACPGAVSCLTAIYERLGLGGD